jgi:stalled ribosome alternative rescue factor ArfA
MVTDTLTRPRAERKEQIAQLLELGVNDSAVIGNHLGVHPRTVQRYLRELEGDVDRRGILYQEIKPQALEHLRKYPHLRISAWTLTRALRIPQRSCRPVLNALKSLERDGLVRHEIGTRKKGDYSTPVKVILWSLAEQEQPDEQ